MKADLASTLEAIARGEGPPLLLLFGDDLQVQQACQAVVDLLVPPEQRGFNLERYDGRETPWESIEGTLNTPPFLPGKKVVWIENAPYFLSREQKDEITGKLLQLWSEGKKSEAAKALMDLLAIEGWTPERWEQLESAGPLIDLAGRDEPASGDEIAALWSYCRENRIGLSPRRAAEAGGMAELLEKKMPPWILLLLSAYQVDRRTRLYKKVEELGAAFFLDLERDRTGRVSKDTVMAFIQQELRKSGKSMEPRAREAMLARAGESLRTLRQELEKLVLYVGADPLIRAQDVTALIADQAESWIFELTRAISEGNARDALGHLSRLLAQGEHPLKLLATIASEIRRLLAARQMLDEELRGRWHPRLSFQQFQQIQQGLGGGTSAARSRSSFADYMNLQRAQLFSRADLARALEAVHQADYQLKSSGQQPRLVLERLILRLCLGATRTSHPARSAGT